MEHYSFKHVSFAYPTEAKKVLDGVTFTIHQGEFVVLCGRSGCGKSTLLRHMKSCLTPHGSHSGEITYKGTPLAQLSQREQAIEIGFVFQSPENQVVTDKVWHELAFGLESLGYDTPTIRRRVAEIAAFFGIENWFYKNVSELSGGQKQLLSLASVMTMQPGVLVLDEPTAQLDPIAATEFLALLGRINREMGTAIILSEHRLEEALPYATRLMVMECGKISCDGTPEEVGLQLKYGNSNMFYAMPTTMQVWASIKTALPCPLNVRDGAQFLTKRADEHALLPLPNEIIPASGDVVLNCENLWFRYEKDSADIVKGFNLQLQKGEFYALLGGNGAGKTTALKTRSGLLTPNRGMIKASGKIGHLPQNPQTLFVKKSLHEDLLEAFRGEKISKEQQELQVAHVANLCNLSELLDRHPYDLSGGEQQRAALAKILLTAPDILLLDEPTKGFDAAFKKSFAQILRRLNAQGVSILMVSHDVDFCAEHAHRCGLFFDGNIVAEGTPRDFFSGNSFYTTPANRMSRHLIPQAVTAKDIIACCGGKTEPVEEIQKPAPVPKQKQVEKSDAPKKLPLWRKILAGIALAAALVIFLFAVGNTDLSSLVDVNRLKDGGEQHLYLYLALIAALFIFLAAVGRRSQPIPHPVTQHKLSKRTLTAATLIVLFIPLTIWAGVAYLGNQYYGITALLVLLECMLPFFLIFESRKPKARELVTIAALCAIGVAGRSAFFMLPQFKPVLALAIISGVALGGETGFLVGAVTMLVSNMMFSQGPWTPWQMFSSGTIGFLAGVLFRKGILQRSRGSLAAFGAFSTLLIYGGVMNFASAIIYNGQSINGSMLLAYYVTGLPMDLVHAAATVIFLLIAAEPMLEKLDRIKTKYGLVE